MISKERAFYKNILWFDKRESFDVDFFEYFQPQRIVSNHPRYKSGVFASEKCGRDIQYESGLELAFIRQLEGLKNVRFYYEQPVRVNYWRGRCKQTYTPDFGVFLDTGEFVIVEVKDLTGMLENRVQMKIEGLMDFCSKRGFGLLFTDGAHTIDKIGRTRCNRKLEKDILSYIDNGILRKNECAAMMEKHGAKQTELLKIVMKNNLRFRSYPFHIKKGNRNHVFYNVFYEKKRYDDLVAEKFPTLFGLKGFKD